MLANVLFVLAGATLSAQDVSVFAPDVVSVPGGNVYRGSFTPNGNRFYFFRKVDQTAEDYRIYVTTREPEGWGDPQLVPLGDGEHSNLYPTVSPDGQRLVFSSYRPVAGDTSAKPNANLWSAEWLGDRWGTPTLLEALSTLANYDAGPSFDRQGNLRWVSVSPDWRTRTHLIARGPHYHERTEDDLLAPWADWRDDVRLWGGVASPDGNIMILGVSEISGRRPLPSDMWISYREGHGWSDPIHLGPSLNTADEFENFFFFSHDGRYLYFVRGFTTYYRVAVEDLPRE
jgi:hypothetical protein